MCETGDFSKSYTFYHIFFMQIRSRNFKKSSSTNGGSLNWKLLNLIAIKQLTIQKNYKTVIGDIEYVITFEDKLFCSLVPSSPLQVIPLIGPFLCNILTPPSTEMMYLKALKLIKDTRKSVPILNNSLF